MAISKFKLAMKAVGGALNPFGSAAASVADYLLDVTNNALKSIDKSNKERIQAVLNTVKKVLAILKAISWLIPTKWQTAYGKTLQAVEMAADALADMEIGRNEPELISKAFEAAVLAWKGEDDETCVEERMTYAMKLMLSIALCACLFSGCVNCYTRCPFTDSRIESAYQSSKFAAGASMLVAFPQVMSCAPSEGISWMNVCTIPLGLLVLCDAVVEAAIDTVCLPVDIPLANMREGNE